MWGTYLDSLATRPLLTKGLTSFVCVLLGDSLAQLIGGAPYSAARVMRLAAYSATVGAWVGHAWHRWLESNVHPEEPTSMKAVSETGARRLACCARRQGWTERGRRRGRASRRCGRTSPYNRPSLLRSRPPRLSQVATKTVMDQLLLSPVMTAAFFTAIKVMEG